MTNFTGHALCQALYLSGITGKNEKLIEEYLRKLWINSGGQFVIDYLKVLKEQTVYELINNDNKFTNTQGSLTVAWNHALHRPKVKSIGFIYAKYKDPMTRLKVIGGMINSITFESASTKQLNKVISGVRTQNQPELSMTLSNEIQSFIGTLVPNLSRNIVKHIAAYQQYSMSDLTNRVLPYGDRGYNIFRLKMQAFKLAQKDRLDDNDLTELHTIIATLQRHTDSQYITAPSIVKQTWTDIVLTAAENDKNNEDHYLRLSLSTSGIISSPYYAWSKNHKPYKGIDLCSSLRGEGKFPPEKCEINGRYDFLQQPGGKLRAIANVNRFTNYVFEPFAKAIEDVIYHHPCVKVKDQKDGLRFVQELLRDGQTLYSFDLSSATDTLNYRIFTKAIIRETMKDDYLLTFVGSDADFSPEQQADIQAAVSNKVLRMYTELFENVSQLPLQCDVLGSPIQFTVGQPLGMKGSFQILTLMNFTAGMIACQRAGVNPVDHFRVVGDDFICTEKVANEYSTIIQQMGGITNLEKTICSKSYGEFLSKLVTPVEIYSIKPKYRLGHKALFLNAEKATKKDILGLYKMSTNEKNAINILQEYSVKDYDFRTNLPKLRSQNHMTSSFDKLVASTYLSLLAKLEASDPKDLTTSKVSIQYALDEQNNSQELAPKTRIVRKKTYRRGKVVSDEKTTTSKNTLNNFVLSEDSEPEIVVPTIVESYDHHTGRNANVVDQGIQQQYTKAIKQANELTKIKDIINGNINDWSGSVDPHYHLTPSQVLDITLDILNQLGLLDANINHRVASSYSFNKLISQFTETDCYRNLINNCISRYYVESKYGHIDAPNADQSYGDCHSANEYDVILEFKNNVNELITLDMHNINALEYHRFKSDYDSNSNNIKERKGGHYGPKQHQECNKVNQHEDRLQSNEINLSCNLNGEGETFEP